MPMTNDDIIARVLASEGGFVNNALDRGGPTNFGITASELGQVRNLGRPANIAEIESLTRDEAAKIYANKYIAAPQFDQIPDMNLRLIIVDSAVLHGITRATKWLQAALAVPVDGQIGPTTLAALGKPIAAQAAKSVLVMRFKFIGQILKAQSSQVIFAPGWLNRVADLIPYC